MGSSSVLLTAVFVLLAAAALIGMVEVEGSIHTYDHDSFKEVGNAFLLSGGSEGIIGTVGGNSFIRFKNITFWRRRESAEQHTAMEASTGLVQAILFESSERDGIGGSAYGGQRSICCTPDLAKLEGCRQGEVLRRPSSSSAAGWPVVISTHFAADLLGAPMDDRSVDVETTGMYNLFFVSCDPSLGESLTVTGTTLWKNPGGYLPGRMAPLASFYALMSAAHLLLGLVWFSQYLRFWREVLPLQNWISLVIALGLLETTLWCLELLSFNATGSRPAGVTAWVVTVAAARTAVSRMLLLSVSMGYGVVRPTLAGLTPKVLLLGAAYFFASELLGLAENVGAISDASGSGRLLLVLPDALLDALLILWIFTSLSRTLEMLQAKRSTVKLELYRRFTNGLALCVIASVGWIAYEVYFKATDPFNERWQRAWIITAFWDILAFLLLSLICYLWAPSQNSQRYAYSGDTDEDNEDAQLLANAGNIGLTKFDRRERINNRINNHSNHNEDDDDDDDDVYDIEDGVEEGKRE